MSAGMIPLCTPNDKYSNVCLIGRRYGELVSSILILQSGSDSMGVGGGGESMLQHDLHQLRLEMIGEGATSRAVTSAMQIVDDALIGV